MTDSSKSKPFNKIKIKMTKVLLLSVPTLRKSSSSENYERAVTAGLGVCNKVSTSRCHSFGFRYWPCERARHQKTLRGLWRPDWEWAACREEPSPWTSWCRWWNGWTRWSGWMGHLAAEPPSPCCCWCRVTATWSKVSTACTQNQHACYLAQTPIVSVIV